ncbi:MAG: nucleotide exchange factor GrpE [Verrucomicrobia bacterium]|nr:nucleotide exchange factor GrpE [Verrucomicrobiota bacterium]
MSDKPDDAQPEEPAPVEAAAAESAPPPADDGPPTPEQLADLKTRAAKAAEHWERLLRTTADLENLRKRAIRDRQDAVRYANEQLFTKLIPVLDNFDAALATAGTTPGASEDSVRVGIQMIHAQLRGALADAGLEEVHAAGGPFDPNLHEAVSHQDSTEVPDGHVLQQLRKGYKLKDRLVRPATVIVARNPAGAAAK